MGMVTTEMAIEAVRQVLPRRRRRMPLTTATRFEEDLGFSSLDVGEVLVRLEELAGRPLDTERIDETRTIGDLLAVRAVAETS